VIQELKLNIPEPATDILIFVHGFGVRWDSRGMFTDIRQSLPEGWGSVLFDLYKIEGKDVFVSSIEEQTQRLSKVLEQVKLNYPKLRTHLLAHSQGCMISALLKPKVSGKVIFLAPPEKIGSRLEEYFDSYPGSERKTGELIVPRKDGTITHIPEEYFKQTANSDVQDFILQYSKEQNISLLHATEDEVLGPKISYSKLANVLSISIAKLAADHNFTAQSRPELVSYVNQVLAS